MTRDSTDTPDDAGPTDSRGDAGTAAAPVAAVGTSDAPGDVETADSPGDGVDTTGTTGDAANTPDVPAAVGGVGAAPGRSTEGPGAATGSAGTGEAASGSAATAPPAEAARPAATPAPVDVPAAVGGVGAAPGRSTDAPGTATGSAGTGEAASGSAATAPPTEAARPAATPAPVDVPAAVGGVGAAPGRSTEGPGAATGSAGTGEAATGSAATAPPTEAARPAAAPAPVTDAVDAAAEVAQPEAAPGVDAAAEVARTGPTGTPVADAVSCTRLAYAFGDTLAVDGLDLAVREGEVFGLLGPNGAGKTTAIRCITTLLPVPAGMVGVFGHDAAKERMAVRRLLGYVPQQLSADSGLTGRENVALFARVFDVPRRERAERVGQALTAVGLTDAADRLAGTYSGGMVRRLELAQALVSAPRLLILDEPTIGLDPIARTGVWEHINAVRAATGMTVLVTTHYMDEADQYCDRVGLMHRGRLRALGTPAELRRDLAERQGTDTLPTLEDVFRDVAGSGLDDHSGGGFRDVRSTRRTARRVG